MRSSAAAVDWNLAPQQPGLSSLPDYRQQVFAWNPRSVKNLALCYQFRTGREARHVRLLPDACMNVLFRCDPGAPNAIFSGIRSEQRDIILSPDCLYFGFKPYSPKGMLPLGDSWEALADTRMPLAELLPAAAGLEERIASAGHFSRRLREITLFARTFLADPDYLPDFTEYAELRLCQTMGGVSLEELCWYTGYTSRYFRERFKASVGISPKRYSSIMRFQNTVRMLFDSKNTALSEIALENGYTDQAHFSREFRRFTGETPLQYRQGALRGVS